MIRTLRHATALTDHREHERLDQSLLQSVADLALGQAKPTRAGQAPRHLQVRLWRVSGQGSNPTSDALVLAATFEPGQVGATSPQPGASAASQGIGPEEDMAAARHALHSTTIATSMRPGPGGTLRCCTWVPVARRQTVMGLLEIESSAPLSPARLNIVQGMCSLYANHLSLLHDSQVDTLTQLLNRKTFDDSIQRVLAMAQSQGPHTWVAVIDIDHFKRINDGYGHLFGDEVLLLVAGMLRRGFRQQDKVFRFGGEEFVVLLPYLEEPGATAALERLRQTIESHPFPQVGQVTVSIGATAIVHGDAACDALGRADDALYHAKSHGRNRVCVFEHLKADGMIAPAATVHGDVDLF